MYAVTPTVVLHVPAEQELPPGQALPHAPQFVVLLVVSTHSLPQPVNPNVHGLLHAPAVQS